MTKANWKRAMSSSDMVTVDVAATNSQHENTLSHTENTVKEEIEMLNVDEAMRNLILPPKILAKEHFAS
jgi:hypothetical protein